MANPYFGSYTLSASGYAAAGGAIVTDMTTALNVMRDLFPEELDSGNPTKPDFNIFSAHQVALIRGEIARIIALMQAAS